MSNEQSNIDIRRLRGVLLQIAQLAREASLTGSLDKGARSAGQQFNRILQIVEQRGIDLAGLFEPMPEDASFDQIGVAATQLVGFLEADEQPSATPAPPHPPQPPHSPTPPFFAPQGPQQGRSGSGEPNFVLDMSQFKELEQLKGLGQMIREQLPEWIKREVEARMSAVHGSAAQAQAHDEQEQDREAPDRHSTQRLPQKGDAGPQSSFRDMDMSGARFSDTNLAGAAFSDVNFDNVQFHDVNFSNVEFHDANFANVEFHDANFDSAQLHGSNFHNVEIIDGNISGMKINGIAIDELLRRHREA